MQQIAKEADRIAQHYRKNFVFSNKDARLKRGVK